MLVSQRNYVIEFNYVVETLSKKKKKKNLDP